MTSNLKKQNNKHTYIIAIIWENVAQGYKIVLKLQFKKKKKNWARQVIWKPRDPDVKP